MEIERSKNWYATDLFFLWPSIRNMGLASIHRINDSHARPRQWHSLPPGSVADFIDDLLQVPCPLQTTFVADSEQDKGQCHKPQPVQQHLHTKALIRKHIHGPKQRHKETERQRNRKTERHRKTDRDRQRQRQGQRQADRERQRERERERERERQRQTKRDRQRETERQRQRDRQTRGTYARLNAFDKCEQLDKPQWLRFLPPNADDQWRDDFQAATR